MKKILPALAFLITLPCLATSSMAATGLSVTGGYSEADDITFFRGAAKFEPELKWFEEGDWQLGLHFDLGLIFLNSDSDVVNIFDDPDSLVAVSLTPVFRLERTPYANTIAPFFEAAVGASFFSEDKIQNSEPVGLDLGGAFQFEDMVSAGIKFGENQQFEISANYFHYSNLGIYDKNDGIDFYSATFAVWF